MKKSLVLVALCLPVLSFAAPCNLERMEKGLMEHFAVSQPVAHQYRTAFEHFLTSLDIYHVRLTRDVNKINLIRMKEDLLRSHGLTESQAEYLVTSMKLVRLAMDSVAIVPSNPRCLGR